MNYNDYVKELFGSQFGLDKYLSVSLQFSSLSKDHVDSLSDAKSLPKHIAKFIEGFDGELSDHEFNSPKFAYRVLFVAKTANRKGQADQVIEFIKADSPLAHDVNKTYTVIKETERSKHLPKEIVRIVRLEGFSRFGIYEHTQLWKQFDAKNPAKGFGTQIATTWYWYESWLETVRRHCQNDKGRYE